MSDWLPIETAPKTGIHIQAADFSGKGIGFGGNPQQSYQCVVHWWQWCDGTHQEEWGWYPSTGAVDTGAIERLTHWKPLEELAASPAEGPAERTASVEQYNKAYVELEAALGIQPAAYELIELVRMAAKRLAAEWPKPGLDHIPATAKVISEDGKPRCPKCGSVAIGINYAIDFAECFSCGCKSTDEDHNYRGLPDGMFAQFFPAYASNISLDEAKNTIKLMLGRLTGIPWTEVKDSAVEAYIEEFRRVTAPSRAEGDAQ